MTPDHPFHECKHADCSRLFATRRGMLVHHHWVHKVGHGPGGMNSRVDTE